MNTLPDAVSKALLILRAALRPQLNHTDYAREALERLHEFESLLKQALRG
jgi:hypothetical protein